MKPFNIDEAKKGAKVCTRDGRPARIICFDRLGAFPIVALVKENEEVENAQVYSSNGNYYIGRQSESDLVMQPTKRTGYVNIYESMRDERGYVRGIEVYNTREEAENNKAFYNFVAVAQITWEE